MRILIILFTTIFLISCSPKIQKQSMCNYRLGCDDEGNPIIFRGISG